MLLQSATHLEKPEEDLVTRQRPLRIGLSLGHPCGSVGSLGGFVILKSDATVRGIISSATVLCPAEARNGDYIHQPGPIDNPMFVGGTRIARLAKAVEPSAGPTRGFDCAFAQLLPEIEIVGNYHGDAIGAVKVNERIELDRDRRHCVTASPVGKLGRGTGRTKGA